MHVEIPVVPHWQCFVVYATVLTDNMWCGGNFVLGGKGTCQVKSFELPFYCVLTTVPNHTVPYLAVSNGSRPTTSAYSFGD